MKKIAMNLLRAVISFGLLAYLITMADLDKIAGVLAQADFSYIGLALVIFLGGVFVLTLRWQVLLKCVGIEPGYRRLLMYYFIGYFLNNFLPTSIGGDVSRAFNVARHSERRSPGIASILLERVLGLLATMTLASLSVIWASAYFRTALVLFVVFTTLFFIAAVLVNIFSETLFRLTSRMMARITLLGVGEKINKLNTAIHAYRHEPSAVLLGYLLSLAAQLLLVVMNYCLAISLNIEQITFSYLLLVIPVSFVISLAPSINGLGVRDFGYKSLLTQIGVSSAQALSLSFLNTLVPMALSTIGGVLLLFYRRYVPPAEAVEKIELIGGGEGKGEGLRIKD